MTACKQCPGSISPTEYDCGFPDCVGGWENAYYDLARRSQLERGLLLWALYHHQGARSEVGQPIRKLLGISQFDRLTDFQIQQGKAAVEELTHAGPITS